MREWSQKHIEELIKKYSGGSGSSIYSTVSIPPTDVNHSKTGTATQDRSRIVLSSNQSFTYNGESCYASVYPLVGSWYVQGNKMRTVMENKEIIFSQGYITEQYDSTEEGIITTRPARIKNIIFGFANLMYDNLYQYRNGTSNATVRNNIVNRAIATISPIYETGSIFDGLSRRIILPIDVYNHLLGASNYYNRFCVLVITKEYVRNPVSVVLNYWFNIDNDELDIFVPA